MGTLQEESKTRDPFQTELLEAVKKRASKSFGDGYDLNDIMRNSFDSELHKKMSKYQDKLDSVTNNAKENVPVLSREFDENENDVIMQRNDLEELQKRSTLGNHAESWHGDRTAEKVGSDQERSSKHKYGRDPGRDKRSGTLRLENELEMLFSSTASLQNDNVETINYEEKPTSSTGISTQEIDRGSKYDDKGNVNLSSRPIASPRKPKPRPRSGAAQQTPGEDRSVIPSEVDNDNKRSTGMLLDELFKYEKDVESGSGEAHAIDHVKGDYPGQLKKITDHGITSHAEKAREKSATDSRKRSVTRSPIDKASDVHWSEANKLQRSLSGDDLKQALFSTSESKERERKAVVRKGNDGVPGTTPMEDQTTNAKLNSVKRNHSQTSNTDHHTLPSQMTGKTSMNVRRSNSNTQKAASHVNLKMDGDTLATSKNNRKKTVTRSVSLTNISNIKPKTANELHQSLLGECETPSALSIRERVYYEWLQKKTLNNFSSTKELAAKQQEEEKQKEAEKKQRKVMAEKTFSVWTERKGQASKGTRQQKDEKLAKEKEKEEEQLQKKLDGRKFYESWKQKKDEKLKEEFKRKQRQARRRKLEEEKEQSEKKVSAQKVFDNWRVKKEEETSKVLESKKEAKKEERMAKMATHERRKEAARAYEQWKQQKVTSPRPPTSPSLTQRSWCPSGRRSNNAIPEKVQPVVLRPERHRTLSASARLNSTQTLR